MHPLHSITSTATWFNVHPTSKIMTIRLWQNVINLHAVHSLYRSALWGGGVWSRRVYGGKWLKAQKLLWANWPGGLKDICGVISKWWVLICLPHFPQNATPSPIFFLYSEQKRKNDKLMKSLGDLRVCFRLSLCI